MVGLIPRRVVSRFSPDVFIVGGWNHLAAWQVLIASKYYGKPIGIISANINQGKISRTILTNLLPLFDKYFSLSKSSEENFRSMGVSESDIVTLPNGIDVDAFRKSISQEKQVNIKERYGISTGPLVTYVGNLEHDKGVQDLISAVSQVGEKVQLLIVGDGPKKQDLVEQAKSANIRAIFTGIIPNSELSNFYSVSDLVALPTYHDTWGLVINEALACGTPVISTTAAGASGEILIDGKNGFITKPGDIENLSNCILKILTSDKLRAEFGDYGREISNNYTPEKYATELRSEMYKMSNHHSTNIS